MNYTKCKIAGDMSNLDNAITDMVSILGRALDEEVPFEVSLNMLAKYIIQNKITFGCDKSVLKRYRIESKVHKKCCMLKNSCLQESVILFFVFGEMGLEPILNIGYIDLSDKNICAHAWLSYQAEKDTCQNPLRVIKQYTYMKYRDKFFQNI